MTIYLDVIWLLNFCIDALLILLTSIVLKRKIKKRRVMAGALVGSSIVILMFTPISQFALHPVSKIFISVIMIFASFGYKRLRTFVQTMLMFYFVTFVIGGGMVAVHFLFQTESELWNGVLATRSTGFGDPISWGVVIFGFPVLWYFSRKRIEDTEMRKVHYDQLVRVEIQIDDKRLEMTGLVDSGNQLYDPITKVPVMVVDVGKTKEVWPEELVERSKNIEELSGTSDTEGHPWEHRLRVVPYRVVGQEHQFLIAVKPDKVKVLYDQQWVETKKVLVGLNHTSLSADGEYDCILHPKMLVNVQGESA